MTKHTNEEPTTDAPTTDETVGLDLEDNEFVEELTDETDTLEEDEPGLEPKVPPFKYGFAVLVNENSEVFIEKDLSLFSIPVERAASLIEIRRYTSEILMDLQAQASAEYASIRIQAAQREQQEEEAPQS